MKKIKNIILITVSIIAIVTVCGLFSVFSDNTDVSSRVVGLASLSFTSDGGESYEMTEEDAYSSGVRLDGVYTFDFVYDEADYGTLTMNMGEGEAEIYVNGNAVFGGNVPSGEGIIGPSGIVFSVVGADNGRYDVTVKARYSNADNYIFPALLTVDTTEEYINTVAEIITPSGVFAGMSGICFLIAVGLFLMSIYYSKPDWSMICLGVASISYCLCCLQETGTFEMSGALGRILPYTIAPEVLLFVFLNRKKRVLKYILIGAAITAAIVTVANVATILIAANVAENTVVFNNVPAVVLKMQMLGKLIYSRSFAQLIKAISNYLLLVCALSVLVDSIRNTVAVQAERNALESQNQAIILAYKNMVASVKETAEVRHEWKHDLLTLSLLYDQGKTEEIGNYLKQKNGFAGRAGGISYTESPVLDVILQSAAARAADENVSLKIHVSAPAELGVKDGDLCQLIMNMFDNAFNACALMNESERSIEFNAELKNGYLSINCSNSCPRSEIEQKKSISHGYGIATMKKICSRYDSELIIKKEDGRFTAMTALQTELEYSAK